MLNDFYFGVWIFNYFENEIPFKVIKVIWGPLLDLNIILYNIIGLLLLHLPVYIVTTIIITNYNKVPHIITICQIANMT